MEDHLSRKSEIPGKTIISKNTNPRRLNQQDAFYGA
jgi:hypothetical protein